MCMVCVEEAAAVVAVSPLLVPRLLYAARIALRHIGLKSVLFLVILLGFTATLWGEDDSVSSSLHPTVAAPMKSDDRKPHAIDWAAYAAVTSYRALDYYTTTRNLSVGCHEDILPSFVVSSHAALGSFEALAAAGEIGASMFLIRHGHRRLARITNAVSISLGVFVVTRNFSQYDQQLEINRLDGGR